LFEDWSLKEIFVCKAVFLAVPVSNDFKALELLALKNVYAKRQ